MSESNKQRANRPNLGNVARAAAAMTMVGALAPAAAAAKKPVSPERPSAAATAVAPYKNNTAVSQAIVRLAARVEANDKNPRRHHTFTYTKHLPNSETAVATIWSAKLRNGKPNVEKIDYVDLTVTEDKHKGPYLDPIVSLTFVKSNDQDPKSKTPEWDILSARRSPNSTIASTTTIFGTVRRDTFSTYPQTNYSDGYVNPDSHITVVPGAATAEQQLLLQQANALLTDMEQGNAISIPGEAS